MAPPRLHPPKFPARLGLVAVQRHRAQAHEHRPSGRVGDHGRGERLVEVTLTYGRAQRRVGILEIKTPWRVPDRFSRPLVEGRNVLAIGAVERQDQEVLIEERRRAGGPVMVADEIGPLPDHVARRRVETGDVRRPETHVDTAFFDDRRRGRIGIEGDAILGLGHVTESLLDQDFPAILIDREDGQFRPVFGGRREPDAVAPNHRRGPCLAGNGGLPDHILRLAPVQRQIRSVAMPLIRRPAIARPILSAHCRARDQEHQEHNPHRRR